MSVRPAATVVIGRFEMSHFCPKTGTFKPFVHPMGKRLTNVTGWFGFSL
jgi:hypothetical protein